MKTCDYCTHVEMCGWRKDVEEQGCEFFDDGMVWIPVSERLPEDSDYYLVTTIYGDVEQMWFAHKKDYDITESEWRETDSGYEVLAWMPLPEPYKRGKADD